MTFSGIQHLALLEIVMADILWVPITGYFMSIISVVSFFFFFIQHLSSDLLIPALFGACVQIRNAGLCLAEYDGLSMKMILPCKYLKRIFHLGFWESLACMAKYTNATILLTLLLINFNIVLFIRFLHY